MIFSSAKRRIFRQPAKTMVFSENDATSENARYPSGMDARTVARIANVKIGTLNAWVQRGLIPGMTIGPSGRRRNIDIETATAISVFAQLVKFGVAPDAASVLVVSAAKHLLNREWLFIPAEEHGAVAVSFHSVDEISTALQDPGAPFLCAIVNVAKLRQRMREAEEQYQKEQRPPT